MGQPHGGAVPRPDASPLPRRVRRSGRSGEWRQAAPRHVRRWEAGSGAAAPERRRHVRRAAGPVNTLSSRWNARQERSRRTPHGRRGNGTPICSNQGLSAWTSLRPAAALRRRAEASPWACLAGCRHGKALGQSLLDRQAACLDERPRRNSPARSGAGPGSARPSARQARISSVQPVRHERAGHRGIETASGLPASAALLPTGT